MPEEEFQPRKRTSSKVCISASLFKIKSVPESLSFLGCQTFCPQKHFLLNM